LGSACDQCPACGKRNSVRAPLGQPPPGSSSSSTGKPVGTAAIGAPPISLPIHTALATSDGRRRSSAWRVPAPDAPSAAEEASRAAAGGGVVGPLTCEPPGQSPSPGLSSEKSGSESWRDIGRHCMKPQYIERWRAG
jgi:hypothetical protein